jgi:hypothetical protein
MSGKLDPAVCRLDVKHLRARLLGLPVRGSPMLFAFLQRTLFTAGRSLGNGAQRRSCRFDCLWNGLRRGPSVCCPSSHYPWIGIRSATPSQNGRQQLCLRRMGNSARTGCSCRTAGLPLACRILCLSIHGQSHHAVPRGAATNVTAPPLEGESAAHVGSDKGLGPVAATTTSALLSPARLGANRHRPATRARVTLQRA